MITCQLIGADAVLVKFQGMESKVVSALRSVITRQAIELQAHVKADKLSGQVLHNSTGNLRTSINYKVLEVAGNISAAVGTNISYAAAHEYGFDGIVTVASFLRRNKEQMKAATYHYTNKAGDVITKTKTTGKFGRSSATTQVRSFQRHQHIQERSFLRSALADLTEDYQQQMAAAVKEAVK